MKPNVKFDKVFDKKFDKLEKSMKIKVLKQVNKIVENPEIGKPMRYERTHTRELYIKPFRISYSWDSGLLVILFLDIYHKDNQ